MQFVQCFQMYISTVFDTTSIAFVTSIPLTDAAPLWHTDWNYRSHRAKSVWPKDGLDQMQKAFWNDKGWHDRWLMRMKGMKYDNDMKWHDNEMVQICGLPVYMQCWVDARQIHPFPYLRKRKRDFTQQLPHSSEQHVRRNSTPLQPVSNKNVPVVTNFLRSDHWMVVWWTKPEESLATAWYSSFEIDHSRGKHYIFSL